MNNGNYYTLDPATVRVVVLGASPNPARISYEATRRLAHKGFDVIPVGKSKGEIEGIRIRTDQPLLEKVHTLSLYVGPDNQPPLYDYILALKPQRIIFNPGTENPELKLQAEEAGIETEYACNLVLLATDQFL